MWANAILFPITSQYPPLVFVCPAPPLSRAPRLGFRERQRSDCILSIFGLNKALEMSFLFYISQIIVSTIDKNQFLCYILLLLFKNWLTDKHFAFL